MCHVKDVPYVTYITLILLNDKIFNVTDINYHSFVSAFMFM